MQNESYWITILIFDFKTYIVYFCIFHSILYNTHAYLLFVFHLSDQTSTERGTYKVRNEIETKRNETKRNEINENETKRNEINKNETKQNEINEMKTK